MVWTASSWGLPVSGPDAEVISAWSYAQVFTWILGIQTQVLMVQDQVLLPVSHPLAPPHPVNVFLFLSVYSLSLHLSCSFQGDRDPIFHGCHRHINFGTMIDTYQKSLNIQVLFIQFENYQTKSVRDYLSKVPVSESLMRWHIKVWLLGRY